MPVLSKFTQLLSCLEICEINTKCGPGSQTHRRVNDYIFGTERRLRQYINQTPLCWEVGRKQDYHYGDTKAFMQKHFQVEFCSFTYSHADKTCQICVENGVSDASLDPKTCTSSVLNKLLWAKNNLPKKKKSMNEWHCLALYALLRMMSLAEWILRCSVLILY